MEQLDILRHAVEALERMKVPYIVVGSIASIAYGESRFDGPDTPPGPGTP